MLNQIFQASEAIIGICVAIGLAVFAKHYAGLKKKAALSDILKVRLDKEHVLDENNATNLESLIERENKRSH